MIQLKIHGATPKGGPSLCRTCKHAHPVKGQNGQEIVFCHVFAGQSSMGPVPFRIAECGTYHPSNVPWLHEMEKMAWKVEARRRGPTGFQNPEDDVMEVIVTPPSNRKNQGPVSE